MRPLLSERNGGNTVMPKYGNTRIDRTGGRDRIDHANRPSKGSRSVGSAATLKAKEAAIHADEGWVCKSRDGKVQFSGTFGECIKQRGSLDWTIEKEQ